MDSDKYQERCINIINTEQFLKLDRDPTKTIENKIQRAIRGIKSKLPDDKYKLLYPTGSIPGRFYGTAKIHKLKEDDYHVDNLPIRPIVSNIGTASYQLAKYLAQLLRPLSISSYTVSNSKEFISCFKNEIQPINYKLISFDVVSLFTNVPLDFTIDLILKRVYRNKEISTDIPQKDMKTLLLLCTKQVHFTYNKQIYSQKDGVAMGSPIGPILANIFMVDLETSLMPNLSSYMTVWRRYVDDTICYIDPSSIEIVLDMLNNFHKNIKFTYEIEHQNKLPFLDVLVEREERSISTAVHHKSTNNDIYLHWNSFAPVNWKRGTIKTLVKRAYTICSNDLILKKEIDHIREVFKNVNGYPTCVIDDVIKKHKQENKIINHNLIIQNNVEHSNIKEHFLVLPYKGEKGFSALKSARKCIEKLLPPTQCMKTVFTAKRLCEKFVIKDPIEKKHRFDITYKVICPMSDCNQQ